MHTHTWSWPLYALLWLSWVPAAAGKAKAGMAHSDCGWTCGCSGKTVKSLENTCHTWALLRWWFTTKRRYIECMHLYLTFIVLMASVTDGQSALPVPPLPLIFLTCSLSHWLVIRRSWPPRCMQFIVCAKSVEFVLVLVIWKDRQICRAHAPLHDQILTLVKRASEYR